jgi:hypothetical protein
MRQAEYGQSAIVPSMDTLRCASLALSILSCLSLHFQAFPFSAGQVLYFIDADSTHAITCLNGINFTSRKYHSAL